MAASVLVWRPALAELYDTAILQGMDKVTARVSTIKAPVGETVRFGALEIIARVCDKKPPEETPESAAFLDIWEVREGESAMEAFRGWMFASSPALSAMEHPVYDVWVLDCKNIKSVVEPAPKPAKPPKVKKPMELSPQQKIW
ncbi:MAG TPA: DUF2155 domain-containing protein [Rhodospirillales bacterium]|nr:DUF2155 domain-containing protein [Rhodospirillales bacterium]